MSLDNWDRRTIRTIVHEIATKPLEEKIDTLQHAFEAQAVKRPWVLTQTPANGKFHKYGTNTAVKIKNIEPDMEILFQFDFDNSLAMIMTFQKNRLVVTETKKMSEMPPKMVAEAQQAAQCAAPGKQTTRIQRRER